MNLEEFLGTIRDEVEDRISNDNHTIYPEHAYMEMVFEHLGDIGVAVDGPEISSHQYSISNKKRLLSGFSLSEDGASLDLFVCLYQNSEQVVDVPDAKLKEAGERCLRVFNDCIDGTIDNAPGLDSSSPLITIAQLIKDVREQLEEIRIFVITDGKTKSKNFKPKEKADGKLLRLEVIDIERLYRHQLSGKPSDDIEVDLQAGGFSVPCVQFRDDAADYDYLLTIIPGQLLYDLYLKFGPRLLESNVRSFLDVKARGTNKGIQNTLRFEPEKFMAYNNGLVMIVDQLVVGKTSQGTPVIHALRGLQIVNGGQTAATIFFSKRKFKDIQLEKVSIAAKIVVLKKENNDVVKQSDLSSNRPFHQHLERVANSTFCPDGVSQWFYERSSGSYTTMLALKGRTPVQLRELKKVIPSSRKLTKMMVGKLVMGWQGKPRVVCLGNEKCFKEFMAYIDEMESKSNYTQPDKEYFKQIVGMNLILKYANKVSKPQFPQGQSFIATYAFSAIASLIGSKISFGYIWQKQDLSSPLKQQIESTVKEVGKFINSTSGGRQISEWTKKQELEDMLYEQQFTIVEADIPELRE